jgi:hypothetical protein
MAVCSCGRSQGYPFRQKQRLKNVARKVTHDWNGDAVPG